MRRLLLTTLWMALAAFLSWLAYTVISWGASSLDIGIIVGAVIMGLALYGIAVLALVVAFRHIE